MRPGISLVVQACLIACFTAARADQSIDPHTLPQLLTNYKELGLALPPDDAELVSHIAGRKNGNQLYRLGLSQGHTVFVGTEHVENDDAWQRVDVATASGYDLTTEWRVESIAINTGIATAIQCEARGWHVLAQTLLVRSLAVSTPARMNRILPESGAEQEANLPAKAALAHVAWAHEYIALTQPDSSRDAISRHMEKLMAGEPSLAASPAKVELLRSLKSSLIPSTSAPGSLDAMIDDLVNVSGNPYSITPDSEFWNNPRLLKVALKGFAAVPALIHHVDDPRLTRTILRMLAGSGPPPAQPAFVRVGAVASCILGEIAGDDPDHVVEQQWGQGYANFRWSDVRASFTPQRALAIRQWWAAASQQGEDAYMASHVFPEMRPGQLRLPFVLMFQILADRYPQRLPTILDAMIADAATPGSRRVSYTIEVPRNVSAVVAIFAHGSLSSEQKIPLLIRAADRTNAQPIRDTLSSAATRELTFFNPTDVEKVRATLYKDNPR